MRRHAWWHLTWPAWPVTLAVVAANLFVCAVIAISLEASYRVYLQRAAVISHNTNRLVSQSIASEIDRIDMGLGVVQDEYARQRADGRVDPARLKELLRRQFERLPMSDGLRLADAQGRVLYGSDASLPAGITIADRDYFVRLRDDPAAQLVVSRPMQGRISGKWILVFARRVGGPGGAFEGVVFAPVAIDWFDRKFAALKVGEHGAVVLRGDASRDFDLLARFPQAGFVGQTTVSPQFREMIGENPQGGTYEARAGADNINRTFSYEPVGQYPLITLVGLATDDTLEEWRSEVAKFALLAVAFAVLTALGGRFLLRSWSARIRAYDEVRFLNAQLERDIAARRQVEAEVTRLNQELEGRVLDRTRELEAANKELESFSYSVSHDLRAPLRAIDGFSKALVEDHAGGLDEDARHCLDRIRGNAVRMGTLIDDMLDFSRTSRRQMETVPVDMNALAREVFDEARAAVPQRDVVLRLGSLPPARGDRAMIRQVLVNLVSNAVKFTAPRPQAVIEIDGRQGYGQNSYTVKDNGVGFDMRHADKLFGVFERLHGTDEFPGTGIGLAIVKRIVERHGGRVAAESTMGEGTTMVFSLPNGET
jgi:signal transduction histidine kinase